MTKTVALIKSNMNVLCQKLASLDNADAAAFNSGIYLTTNGNAYEYKNNTFTKIPVTLSSMGYVYISASYLLPTAKGIKLIDIPNGTVSGRYLHEMMVYSFRDGQDQAFVKTLPIDHVNLNHLDNSVNNLHVVTTVENIIRWMVATDFSDNSVAAYNREIEALFTKAQANETAQSILTSWTNLLTAYQVNRKHFLEGVTFKPEE